MCAIQDLITPRELSKKMGIPVGSLSNMRYRRVGPKYIKYGKRVFYDKKDIEAYLQENKVATIDQY